MKIFVKLLVYGGLVVATFLTLLSMMLWPDYKIETGDIVAALERNAASFELNEVQEKDFNNYMGWIMNNERALNEWGDDRVEFHFAVYGIYLLSTFVLLRTVRKKNKIIKELENNSD